MVPPKWTAPSDDGSAHEQTGIPPEQKVSGGAGEGLGRPTPIGAPPGATPDHPVTVRHPEVDTLGGLRAAVAAPVEDFDPAIRDEFARHVHHYQSHYIGVAEAKAGFVATTAVGALAFLDNKGALDVSSLQMGQVGTWVGLATAAAFVVAGLCAVRVVWPRLGVGSDSPDGRDATGQPPAPSMAAAVPAGLIFWDQVRRHGSAASYAASVSRLTPAGVQRELSVHTFVLAGINQAKYRAIGHAIRWWLAGLALLCAYLLFREPASSALPPSSASATPPAGSAASPTAPPAPIPAAATVPAPAPPSGTGPSGQPPSAPQAGGAREGVAGPAGPRSP